MLISLRWLEELLDFPEPGPGALPLEGEQVAETLTGLGLEVEQLRSYGPLDGVVVAEILEVAAHPSADRLHVVALDDGRGRTQVVCGADNLPPPGGKVAFARVGTRLPEGLEIGERELRGVASSGMICSEKELDVGPDSGGILVLPEAWTAGTALHELVPEIVDTVIEIAVTPNRPDALGHLGVARDLALALGGTLRAPRAWAPEEVASLGELPELVAFDPSGGAAAAEQIGRLCGRYLGVALDGVRVGPSPLAARVRLHRVGQRPINNVVDVTNLVLMETGQPMHAFDRGRLAQGRLELRCARPGESLRTLDDAVLELDPHDLLIADPRAGQALAGVMGGHESMVEEGCEALLLEVAHFDPATVRSSARRHGLHTDASHRFERGVDPGEGLELAARRAIFLLMDHAHARPVGKRELRGVSKAAPRIELGPAKVEALLGVPIPAGRCVEILEGLGVQVTASPGDPSCWSCTPPSWRPDLERAEDLVEEIMRHHGLGVIPSRPAMPTGYGEDTERAVVYATADRLVDTMAARGYHEHLAFAFSGSEALAALGDAVDPSAAVQVANPMRGAHSQLRMHLLPGLLDALAANLGRHGRRVALFELGRIYDWAPRGAESEATAPVDAGLPRERLRLAALVGAPDPSPEGAAALARRLGADLVIALGGLGHAARLRPAAPETRDLTLHPGVQVSIELRVDGSWRQCGVVGEVHPDVLDHWSLPRDRPRAVYGELWLEQVPARRLAQARELPRFPATTRDVSIEIDTTLPASQLVDALRSAAGADGAHPVQIDEGEALGAAVQILEDYRGSGLARGRRALLLRLAYRAADRSLVDDEVQARHDAIVDAAIASLRAAGVDLSRR